jgi:hypothetical protein
MFKGRRDYGDLYTGARNYANGMGVLTEYLVLKDTVYGFSNIL